MRFPSYRHGFIYIAFSVILLLACASNPAESENNGGNGDIPETTKIIGNADWDLFHIHSSDDGFSHIFNKSITSKISFHADDILVSGSGEGLIQRIDKVDIGDNIVSIETSQASLAEAVGDADASLQLNLPPVSLSKIPPVRDGFRLDALSKTNHLLFSIDAVLYDADGNPGTKTDQIRISGSCSIDPGIDGHVTVAGSRIQELRFETTVIQDLTLNLSVTMNEISLQKEELFAEVPLGSYTIPVNGLPVVLTPVLKLSLGADVDVHSTVTSNIEQQLTCTTGFEYKNGAWNPVSAVDTSFSYTPPALNNNARAKAYVRTDFDVKVSGVLSPSLYGQFYGEVSASLLANLWWKLYAGVELGGGIKAGIWGMTLLDYSVSFMNVRELIAESSSETGNPILTVTPATLNFAEGETQKQIMIQNTGFGRLNWSISENIPWLYVLTGSGTATTEIDQVDVTVDASLLSNGSHTSTFWVVSNGGDQQVTVNVDVGPPPQMTMEWVSIGQNLTFTMGDTWGDGYASERPAHQVTLSAYSIGKYEVTNEQFCIFLNEALQAGSVSVQDGYVMNPAGTEYYMNLTEDYCRIDYSGGRFTVDTGMKNHPVVSVSWNGASAMAAYYGWRLPTEAEWERAARGPDPGVKWPWGNTEPTPALANYYASGIGTTTPVGNYPSGKSPDGCEDMAGNVYEWCYDWYDSSYPEEAQIDPTGPEHGVQRVIRGGYFDDPWANTLRTISRNNQWEGSMASQIGFRVARTN
ncbi:SUMF1/EgtB/PvdO family nonheme iron enzyme [bacterium]|nr:SUMF1/EgtB/PvdO family nonheme iron enzyme [bacterium]